MGGGRRAALLRLALPARRQLRRPAAAAEGSHAAAAPHRYVNESVEDPLRYYDHNVLGTINLAKARGEGGGGALQALQAAAGGATLRASTGGGNQPAQRRPAPPP